MDVSKIETPSPASVDIVLNLISEHSGLPLDKVKEEVPELAGIQGDVEFIIESLQLDVDGGIDVRASIDFTEGTTHTTFDQDGAYAESNCTADFSMTILPGTRKAPGSVENWVYNDGLDFGPTLQDPEFTS